MFRAGSGQIDNFGQLPAELMARICLHAYTYPDVVCLHCHYLLMLASVLESALVIWISRGDSRSY